MDKRTKLYGDAEKEVAQEIITALENAKLPVTEWSIGRMAFWMQEAFLLIEEFPKASEVVFLVKKDLKEMRKMIKEMKKCAKL